MKIQKKEALNMNIHVKYIMQISTAKLETFFFIFLDFLIRK